MATSFSKAQTATFTGAGFESVAYLTDLTVATQRPLVEITQTTALTMPFYDDLLASTTVTGMQIQPALGVAQLSTTSFGSNFKIAVLTINKNWKPVNITGSGDSELEFGWEMPVVSGTVTGWSTGALDEEQVGGALDITINVYGDIDVASSGDTTNWVQRIQYGVPKRRGGPIPVAVQFKASGLVTASTSTLDFAAVQVDPPSGTLAMTLSGGPAPSFNALNIGISIRANMDRGGPVLFRRTFLRSKA